MQYHRTRENHVYALEYLDSNLFDEKLQLNLDLLWLRIKPILKHTDKMGYKTDAERIEKTDRS